MTLTPEIVDDKLEDKPAAEELTALKITTEDERLELTVPNVEDNEDKIKFDELTEDEREATVEDIMRTVEFDEETLEDNEDIVATVEDREELTRVNVPIVEVKLDDTRTRDEDISVSSPA
jgi:hypothetical protein